MTILSSVIGVLKSLKVTKNKNKKNSEVWEKNCIFWLDANIETASGLSVTCTVDIQSRLYDALSQFLLFVQSE
jgi:hypothetical protein